MFKRANKITALVVAAASIMSVVPAMAADAQRLGTKKGSIKEAYAFDGTYIYEGYKGDDADRAIYSNIKGTEKQVDELDNVGFTSAHTVATGDYVAKFGDKYLAVKDGKDEYAIDLSDAKVYDDDDTKLASSIADSAARKLRNKLKNTDRYTDNDMWDVDSNNAGFKTLFENQFGDTWYQYTTGAATTPQSVVFNTTGQYVDISNDLNLKLYNSSRKLVTVEEYAKTKDGIEVVVKAGTQPQVIAADKDYVYVLVEVQATGAINIHTGDPLDGQTLTLIQKISKAQGSEKKDKAYLPKSTESFMYSSAQYDDNTGNTAIDKLFDVDDTDEAGKALDAAKNGAGVRVIDGVLYVVTGKDYSVANNGKVKITAVKLNNHAKVEGVDTNGKHVKFDVYLAVGGDDTDTDADGYSIDTDGNVWIAHDGEIKKSVKAKDFETIYDVDSSIDTLDVYNEGNLIAWSSDSDRYTTIAEGKKQTTDDAVVVDPNVNADKFKTGFDATTKKYYKDGALVTNAWVSDAGKWYFVDENSTAKTGWYKNAQGTYYYLQADGAMLTGWFKDPADGNWYYLDPVNTSGAMKTGWFQDTTGTWYFAEGSGKMLSNTYVGQYWLNGSGAWVQ